MRNVCRTVDDFLENLRIELSTYANKFKKLQEVSLPKNYTRYTPAVKTPLTLSFPVHRKSIFYTQLNEPIGENKREAMRFNVSVLLSAIISTEEGEYLLECSENMGIDYMDGEPELNGSKKAETTLAGIEGFCSANGLTIRPGSLSI